MLNGPAKIRLHIRSIEEISLDQDEELAELFREMREATEFSVEETAERLQTAPEIVMALEKGAIGELPPWPETQRIVASYAELLQLDPDPMLRRIMLQLPSDHPQRPKTERVTPSHDDVNANIKAAINRVPDYHEAHESDSVPVQPQGENPAARAIPPGIRPPATGATRSQPPVQRIEPRQPVSGGQQAPHAGASRPAPQGSAAAPAPQAPRRPASGQTRGYDEFRAFPPETPPAPKPKRRVVQVESRRKGGISVLMLQLFLLLVLLASGYAMWLAAYDPQGFDQLKVSIGNGISSAIEGLQAMIRQYSSGGGTSSGPS